MDTSPTKVSTVSDALNAAASAHPTRDAYVHGDKKITYAQLDSAASNLAAALVDLGMRPGQILCNLLPSSPEFACTYLGAIRAGLATSSINQRLGPNEKSSIVECTRPTVTVALDDEAVGDGHQLIIRYSELKEILVQQGRSELPNLEPSDTVAIVWTSGTTGAPKGAIYDHNSLRAIHDGMGDLTVAADRRLVSLPFAHMGYMTRIWDELSAGTTIVLVGEPWSAAKQIALIESERITVATGVPTQWELILANDALKDCDTTALRVAGVGGAAVSPDLVRRMREQLRCDVITRYTSTEAGLISGTRIGDSDEVVANTVGRASSVVAMKLVDHLTGCEIAHGEIGEVRTKSRACFKGYFQDNAATSAAFDEHGYLKTGDLGMFDTDGNLRIVGRLKEMYIRGGYNVYPVEVEATLAEHPDVALVAVIGIGAAVLGEIGVAFVVPANPSKPPTLESLRLWCTRRLADYKAPDRVHVVKELPVTSGSKINKQQLAKLAQTLEGTL